MRPKAAAPEQRRLYAGHLVESREHARRVDERLEALGGDHSTVKDTALRAAALNWGLFFEALSDTPAKLAVFAYAFEHLEIAGYELLKRVAARAGDEETVALCDSILTEERAMAERVAGAFDLAFQASLAEEREEATAVSYARVAAGVMNTPGEVETALAAIRALAAA